MRQLQPRVKTYDWGMPVQTTSSSSSLASSFVAEGRRKDHDTIAELWWGHPDVVVAHHDEETTTTTTIGIPFLLKLLFVGKPLSLQAHPTLPQIHQHQHHRRTCFTDPLPKPEIVIALTDFEALCGFLPEKTVLERIQPVPLLAFYPVFASLFEPTIPTDLDQLLSSAYNYAVQYPTIPHCRVFLSLLALYPSGDPAVLCPFYMEHVVLKKGQALVIPASQPHCYLSGQGVECMPPSDNVVRCGLTSKTCDRSLFFQITQSSPVHAIVRDHDSYDHPELDPYFHLSIPKSGDVCVCRKHSILLVLDGKGVIGDRHTQKGDSWIVEEETTLCFPEELHILVAMPGEK